MIDGRLPSLNRLSEHRKLLERAVARLRDDVRVVGLVAGGSLAHGAADFYSDVDLYIVVQDEAFDGIFAERDVIVEAVGSPLFSFTPSIPCPAALPTTSSSTRARSSSTSCI